MTFRFNVWLLFLIPHSSLYLAVSSDVEQESFVIPFVQAALKTNQIKYLVYDIEKEIITKWKN